MIVILLFLSGWLFPKYFGIGVTEVAGLLLIFLYCRNGVITKFQLNHSKEILLFAFYSFLTSTIWILSDDFEGLIRSMRLLGYAFMFLLFFRLPTKKVQKAIQLYDIILIIYLVFYFYRLSQSLTIFNLIYGGYALKPPVYDLQSASAQIPFSLNLAYYSILRINHRIHPFSFIATIFTTTRSTIIGFIPKLLSKKRFLIFAIPIFALILIKSFSFTKSSKIIDGSSLKRLEYYKLGKEIATENIQTLFLGNGYGLKSLEKKIGHETFESFLIDSLLQGGIILLILSILIIRRFWILSKLLNNKTLFYIIFISALLGGNNLFSPYAFPILTILIPLNLNKIHANSTFN